MFDKIEAEEGYTIVKEILDERLQALKNQSLLEAIGIEDVTAVLGNPDQDADTDEDWNMDEEEDIAS